MKLLPAYFSASDTGARHWLGQERFRGAFMHSGIGMALVSTKGQFLDVNFALCRFLGYEESDLLASDFQTLTHPEDLDQDMGNVKRMLEREIDTYTIEKRYRHKSGRFLWGLLTVSLVVKKDGTPRFFLSQIQDIDESRKNAERIRIERELLATATEAGEVGVWEVSLDDQLMTYNEVACRILQRSPEENTIALVDYFAALHPEDREITKAAFESALEKNLHYRREHRVITGKGEIRFLRTRGHCIPDPAGQPIRMVGSFVDISLEKKVAEELMRARDAAEEANQAKSDFLAMMSHEIRTPMNAVMGFTALLKSTPLNEEQQGFLDTIELSGERLLSLINDVLDLAKIESGTVQARLEPFPLRECVEEAFALFRPTATAKGLSYELMIDADTPLGMQGDRRRLAQILINLLGNAVKFTEEGGVLLKVDAKQGSGDCWNWRFRIADTGPGVPPGMEDQIFQMFIQGESGRTRSHGGSGMGLAISQRLAALLQGKIGFQNRPQGGSEFSLQIEAAVTPLLVEQKRGEAQDFQGKSILVVEDNETNQKLCLLQLRRLGCEPEFVGTGTAAVEETGRREFDLVLMDMQLPGLDGCEATRAIRERDKGARHLPIVAMTANAMPEDRQACLEAGMDDYLSKPLKLTGLSDMLAKWL